MSASDRQKIAAAQRARWAKVKRGTESGLKETKPRIQLPAKFDSPQLKVGIANQRHPFSPAAILSKIQ